MHYLCLLAVKDEVDLEELCFALLTQHPRLSSDNRTWPNVHVIGELLLECKVSCVLHVYSAV